MNIDFQKLLKISLLITFLSLAPAAILSQDSEDKTVEGVNPPTSKNSIETPDGMIKWRYHIQYREFKVLEPLIKEYIVNYLNSISTKKGNTYIYYTEQKAIFFIIEKRFVDFVRKFMNKIDSPRNQVRIYVKVISITYEHETQAGFEMAHNIGTKSGNSNLYYRGFEFSFHPDDFITALSENPPGTGNSYWAAQDDFLGTTIFFKTAGESVGRIGDLGGAYRLLSKTEKVRIIAQPYVTVEAGYEAIFETGEEVPVSTIKTVGTTTVVSTTFEKVGIRLTIEPKNIGTDYVELYVKPEISAVSRYFDPGGALIKYPVIIRRNAQTTVPLHSGSTFDIGGIKSNRSLINATGIPILSDIPLVGYLFRANRKEIKRQDIVFKITPEIRKPGDKPSPNEASLTSKGWTITE